MDKRVIFAVAGAGKTTYIVNRLSRGKRSLIITYTNANYNNLRKKIIVIVLFYLIELKLKE